VSRQTPRIVQQGPLPVHFATGFAALDVTEEYVAVTFAADQLWGGIAVQERELVARIVFPRSAFDAIRVAVQERLGPVAAEMVELVPRH
jgi:hypothetical protein